MDLYGLLPAIVRFKDRLASGIVGQNPAESLLQKFFYALEQEGETTEGLIDGLRDFVEAESCPAEYLPLLEGLLGSEWPASWPESRQRLAIAALVKLYHNSGQRLSWRAVLNLLQHVDFFPWELWKEEVYEDFDYCLYGTDAGDYYCPYHAARVDIRKADETYRTLIDAEKALLETFRPIHVLIREIPVLEEIVETDVTSSVSSSEAFEAGLVVEDELSDASDSYSIAVSCVASCETACEVGGGEVGFTGNVITTDPASGDPVLLIIVAGQVTNYTGNVSVIPPVTGAPQLLTISGGLVTNFLGDVVATDPTTGDPVALEVMMGGIDG